MPSTLPLGRLAVLLLLAAPAPALQPSGPVPQQGAKDGAKDVMTPSLVARLRAVSSAEISPDGARVAFTRSVPREPGGDEDGSAWTELHLLDLESGRERPFVTGEVQVGSCAWTPDSAAITFLAKREGDEDRALYRIPVDGGEARKVLSVEGGIRAYSLAPDGERVAVIAGPPKDETLEKLKKKGFKQEIYEEDWRPARLMVAELEGEPRALEFEGHPHQVRWSPVDERLLISWTPTPLVDDEYVRHRAAVLDGATGQVLARLENPGKLGEVRWSPDGKLVALVAGGDRHDPDAGRLLVAPSTGGELVDVLPEYPGDVEALAWQDATTLMAVISRGVWRVLEEIELAGGRAGARKELIAPGGPILDGISLSADGQRAAFTGETPEHPGEVFTMAHGDAGPQRRTVSNDWLDGVRLAPHEVVRYRARDELEIEGILIPPLERAQGQRVPLILYVHGGPEAHHSDGWLTSYSAPGQVAAARGFAVFYTNYRGSTGRGVEFSKLSQGDPAGKEFDDLVDAVDHLVERGLADPAKVGVTGGSYGGYATAWLSTRYTDRFAAGVMFVGISDKISKVGTTDIADEEYYVHARKRPWEAWQFFLERSPIYHAEQARTPLLILHGKDDPRVDPGQSRELYRHLKLHGKTPVRLVLYPGEGHGNRKAAARLDYNLRMLRWFEHYLQGEGGDPPPYELEYPKPSKSVADQPAEAGAPAGAGSGR